MPNYVFCSFGGSPWSPYLFLLFLDTLTLVLFVFEKKMIFGIFFEKIWHSKTKGFHFLVGIFGPKYTNFYKKRRIFQIYDYFKLILLSFCCLFTKLGILRIFQNVLNVFLNTVLQIKINFYLKIEVFLDKFWKKQLFCGISDFRLIFWKLVHFGPKKLKIKEILVLYFVIFFRKNAKNHFFFKM